MDAIGVLAALFGLAAYATSVRKFRLRKWWSAVLLAALGIVFSLLFLESFRWAHRVIGPRLYDI